MTKIKVLPPIRYFISLAQDSQFPATTKQLLDNAEKWGFLQSVKDFLMQFPEDETFSSRVDFETRCEELEMFIRQEKTMPKEILRSPQD